MDFRVLFGELSVLVGELRVLVGKLCVLVGNNCLPLIVTNKAVVSRRGFYLLH